MTDPQKDERPAAPIDPQNPEPEATPIGEELTRELAKAKEDAKAKERATAEDDDDDEELTEVPFAAKSYKVDVDRALARSTNDGKGDDEVPPSNWQGYATDDVEEQD